MVHQGGTPHDAVYDTLQMRDGGREVGCVPRGCRCPWTVGSCSWRGGHGPRASCAPRPSARSAPWTARRCAKEKDARTPRVSGETAHNSRAIYGDGIRNSVGERWVAGRFGAHGRGAYAVMSSSSPSSYTTCHGFDTRPTEPSLSQGEEKSSLGDD
jgi:hypothetical protein